jgi:hypothetical protein
MEQRYVRVAAVLLLGVVAGMAGCGGGGGSLGDAEPAAAWGALREALLRKDWDAVWDACTPASRNVYETRFAEFKTRVAAGEKGVDVGLRMMNLRREELQTMDGKGFFRATMRLLSEGEAFRTSWEKMRADFTGKRVERVETAGDAAVLTIRGADGKAETLQAQRIGGRWFIDFPVGGP